MPGKSTFGILSVVAAVALLIATAAIGGCLSRSSEETKAVGQNQAATSEKKVPKEVPADQKQVAGDIQAPKESPPQTPSTLPTEAPDDFSEDQTYDEPDDVAYVPKDVEPTRDDIANPARPKTGATGRLAIVIDDFGYRSEATSRILSIDEPLTCAVLPDARTTAEDGIDAFNAGKLVIVHIPMEAVDNSKSKGSGFIRSGMTEEEVDALIEEAVSKVPMAKGISNHMGSRATQDGPVMLCVMEETMERGLFFLDSRTSTASVAADVAIDLGARAYANDMFIDSVDDVQYVKDKIWQAAEKAKQEGQAVAIGHVKASTATALEQVLPLLKDYGVELVFLNELKPLD